ncbi:MAG: putative 4-mercaptohistidine N1-methyltransferase, partial [Petrimonas sp.]|nr:putative 4-mercaptohistidine N1-methyltransferase [Petrimonas sp.]
HFNDVTALDFTARMIRIPIQLQEQGYMRYTMKDEGELVHFRDVVLSDFGLEEGKGNILFMQADAMNLKPNYSGYDIIVMPGLLEELSDPKLFLSHIHERVNDGGYLVIVSSYNWDLSKTRRDKWLGGFKRDGEPVTSLDGLRSVLENHFEMEREPFDVELTVRKTSRITEKRVLETTVWRKK